MVHLLERVLKVERQGGRLLSVGPLRQAAELFQTTPEHLLWNHTTFPYASAFVREADYTKAIQEALGPARQSRTLNGVMRNAIVGFEFRRVCKACLKEDLAQFGESFWHRSHNLPGAFYCAKHRCALHPTTLGAHGKTSLQLPVECELGAIPQGWYSPCSWSLSASSQTILHRAPGVGQQRTAAFYRSLAVELGWMEDGTQVSQPALVRLMRSSFGDVFLEAAAAEFAESRAWPVRAFNPRACNLSTFRHLVMEVALRSGTVKGGGLSHRPKGAPRANYQAIDAALSRLAEVELQRIMSASERVTREEFLRRIGGMAAYKGYWKQCPKLLALAQKLQAWNATLSTAPVIVRSEETAQALDERLAAAAENEFKRVVAANETLTLDSFMKRIGALKAWKKRKAECPKLVASAEPVKAWNAVRAIDARRPKWQVRDDRLSVAADAELQKVIASNEQITLEAFMKRLGGTTAWQYYKSEHPKLADVARRFRVWNKTRRADAPSKNWQEIDDRLSRSASALLEESVTSGESLTMYDLLRRLKATRLWNEHKSDCPKLVAIAERCRALTESRVKARRRPNFAERDKKLSEAALAELKRLMASGERLTLLTFMERVGASTTWEVYKKECPKLQEVAAEFRAWKRQLGLLPRQG